MTNLPDDEEPAGVGASARMRVVPADHVLAYSAAAITAAGGHRNIDAIARGFDETTGEYADDVADAACLAAGSDTGTTDVPPVRAVDRIARSLRLGLESLRNRGLWRGVSGRTPNLGHCYCLGGHPGVGPLAGCARRGRTHAR